MANVEFHRDAIDEMARTIHVPEKEHPWFIRVIFKLRITDDIDQAYIFALSVAAILTFASVLLLFSGSSTLDLNEKSLQRARTVDQSTYADFRN